jgi:hypothetical protein
MGVNFFFFPVEEFRVLLKTLIGAVSKSFCELEAVKQDGSVASIDWGVRWQIEGLKGGSSCLRNSQPSGMVCHSYLLSRSENLSLVAIMAPDLDLAESCGATNHIYSEFGSLGCVPILFFILQVANLIYA